MRPWDGGEREDGGFRHRTLGSGSAPQPSPRPGARLDQRPPPGHATTRRVARPWATTPSMASMGANRLATQPSTPRAGHRVRRSRLSVPRPRSPAPPPACQAQPAFDVDGHPTRSERETGSSRSGAPKPACQWCHIHPVKTRGCSRRCWWVVRAERRGLKAYVVWPCGSPNVMTSGLDEEVPGEPPGCFCCIGRPMRSAAESSNLEVIAVLANDASASALVTRQPSHAELRPRRRCRRRAFQPLYSVVPVVTATWVLVSRLRCFCSSGPVQNRTRRRARRPRAGRRGDARPRAR